MRKESNCICHSGSPRNISAFRVQEGKSQMCHPFKKTSRRSCGLLSNRGLNYLNSMHHNIQFATKTESDRQHLIYRPDQCCGHSVFGKPINKSLFEQEIRTPPPNQQSLLYILPYKVKIYDPEFLHRTRHPLRNLCYTKCTRYPCPHPTAIESNTTQTKPHVSDFL
jgi:hypothetical protein